MGALAAFTLKELLRKRLVAVAAVVTGVFLALYATGLHLLAGSHSVVTSLFGGAGVVLMGLYLSSPLPALLAILTTAGILSSEVESGALQSVLARPVSRARVAVARYLACASLLVAYTLLLQVSVLLLARGLAGARLPDAAQALGLFCLEPLALAALALLGSAFLPTLANGAALVLLYGLSAVGGVLEQAGTMSGTPTLVDIGIATSLLLPADAVYRKAAASVMHGSTGTLLWQLLGPAGGSVSAPSDAMVVYVGLYVVVAVALGSLLFSRRDV